MPEAASGHDAARRMRGFMRGDASAEPNPGGGFYGAPKYFPGKIHNRSYTYLARTRKGSSRPTTLRLCPFRSDRLLRDRTGGSNRSPSASESVVNERQIEFGEMRRGEFDRLPVQDVGGAGDPRSRPTGSRNTQISRKLRSLCCGCVSLRSALASICRIRSRVTENWFPTSSKV